MRKFKKALVFFTVFVFIFDLFPTSIITKADDDINIISSTTVSVETAKAWAKSNNATETFISLADLYWKYASEHGNVNPLVAYVQAAKETGYGNFGGVINESYNNPCGLKTRAGGDDNDPSAHQKFNSWDEGVQAHLDHLALYAGADGYPRATTYDSRHFSSVFGKAKTVSKLGGAWAPSSTYGTEIIALYNKAANTADSNASNANNNSTLGSSDSNQNAQTNTVAKKPLYAVLDQTKLNGNSLTISGWGLNPSGVKSVDVYVGSIKIGSLDCGQSRPDVNAAYPGYTDGDKSGFSGTVDVAQVTGGNRTFEVRITGNDGSKQSLTTVVSISRKQANMSIDVPQDNYSTTAKSIKVEGWAINDSKIKEIKVYVDGVYKTSATYGSSRSDVNAAYPGYATGKNCGFIATLDISGLAGGTRVITVEQIGEDGIVTTARKTIKINKPTPIANIDQTRLNGNSLTISGWGLNPSGVKSVDVYVGSIKIGSLESGQSRSDVNAAYPGYTDGDKSGFSGTVDIAQVTGGNRTFEIRITGNDGSKQSLTKVVSISRKQPYINIDTPQDNYNTNAKSIKVQGWAISDSKIKELKVYVDGVYKTSATYGSSRSDVNAAYPGYATGKNCGFTATLDISNLANGRRLITVEQIGEDGIVIRDTRTINIAKPTPIANIDQMKLNGNSLTISGWGLNPSGVKSVDVYVGSIKVGSLDCGKSRADVDALYPGYPDGDKSGFSGTIDVAQVTAGNRTFEVRITGNDGTTQSLTKVVGITRKQPIINVDAPFENYTTNDKSLNMKGWVVSDSKVKEVKIYVDGVYKTSATYGQSRSDVNAAYPGYATGNNCGFTATIDISNLAGGSRLITVEQIGEDGIVTKVTRTIKIDKPVPLVRLDSGVVKDNVLTINGWALNPSGVKEIQVYVNGEYKGNATYGETRNDIKALYPSYPNADKCGYSGTFDVKDIPTGLKSLEIKQIGNDGTTVSHIDAVTVKRKDAILFVDSPSDQYLEKDDSLYIGGWAVNDCGIKSVEILVDGSKKAVAKLSQRPDVQAAYPSYTDSLNSGYSADLDLTGLKQGKHTAKIVVNGVDGSVNTKTLTFYYKVKGALVVLDPGHNKGGDYGATATHNGTLYEETVLNMKVAWETKTELEAAGYNVILTRDSLYGDTLGVTDSLRSRANIANTMQADVFISIHQNSGDSSARGTEVYYNNGTAPDSSSIVHQDCKISKSVQLGRNVVNNICGRTGFYNRGVKADTVLYNSGLSVLRNTEMPAILIECGFISNASEASSLSNPAIQEQIGVAIKDGVKSNF